MLYKTCIVSAVISGLLLMMLLADIVSNKYSNNKIYKIYIELFTAGLLVLYSFILYFTSDTVITDPNADTIIRPPGDNSEPTGKSKPYYLMGFSAGIIGILSAVMVLSKIFQ